MIALAGRVVGVVRPRSRGGSRREGVRSVGVPDGFLFGDVAMLVANTRKGTRDEPNMSGYGVAPIAYPRCGYVMLFEGRSPPSEITTA